MTAKEIMIIFQTLCKVGYWNYQVIFRESEIEKDPECDDKNKVIIIYVCTLNS